LAVLSIGLGFWLILGAVAEIAFRIKMFKEPLGAVWRRARNLQRSAYGTALAHAGVGVMVLGITAVSAWRVEKVELMAPADRIAIAGVEVEFMGVKPRQGPNYRSDVGVFKAWDGKRLITTLESSKRTFTANRQQTTEAAIYAFWSGDLYVVLGDKQKTGSYAVRMYFNPLAPFIWFGALIMFIGGFISLTDRRYRVGAPRRAAAKIGKAAKA
jgi:cytochrome c-type biogenesis protein CcmF